MDKLALCAQETWAKKRTFVKHSFCSFEIKFAEQFSSLLILRFVFHVSWFSCQWNTMCNGIRARTNAMNYIVWQLLSLLFALWEQIRPIKENRAHCACVLSSSIYLSHRDRSTYCVLCIQYIPNASVRVQSLSVSSAMTCSSCIFRRKNIVQKSKLNRYVSFVELQTKWFSLSISFVHFFCSKAFI